jgi:MarR family transcriptional regulator, organic hydroperoxide resistance regulator
VRHAEELRYLVLAAQREGNRAFARRLRPLGLTPSQAEVLRLLDERQPLSLTGLGELLVCESGTNPSRLVDRLVTTGLVRRDVAEHDRRNVELSLTDDGRTAAGRVAEVEAELYQFIDGALGDRDPSPVTGFLWALVAGRPAGDALRRRGGRPG